MAEEKSTFRIALEDHRKGVERDEAEHPQDPAVQGKPQVQNQSEQQSSSQVGLKEHFFWFLSRIVAPWAVSYASLIVLAWRIAEAGGGGRFISSLLEEVSKFQGIGFFLYALVLGFFRWQKLRDEQLIERLKQ